MANKIISRFSVKMPHNKNEEKIRYELELIKQDDMYKIYRYKYISNKINKVEQRGTSTIMYTIKCILLQEMENLICAI